MNEKGQTIVEFACTAILLFTMLLAIIDFAVMFWVNLTMQHAVREGARFGITGHNPALLEQRIGEASMGLYDPKDPDKKAPKVYLIERDDIKGPFANYTSKKESDMGKPDKIYLVTLTYSWPLMTPIVRPFFKDGKYTFTVRTTMKTEKWS